MEGQFSVKWCARCGANTAHYILRGEEKGCVLCHHREDARRFRQEHRVERNAMERRRYAKNPEKFRALSRRRHASNPDRQRNWTLKKKYGVGLAEYNSLWKQQGGKCLICEQTKPLVVDHDHATGAIRGLLCQKCNVALALSGDTYEGVLRVLNYLTPSETVWTKSKN